MSKPRIPWPELLFRTQMDASAILGVFATVDQRSMAADGPVTPTEREITSSELRIIYLAALRIERLAETREQPGQSGVCRFCGCTDAYACELDGDTCMWLDAKHTVCSNPVCAEEAKLRRPRGRRRK
jgi:hypothetical protein